MADEHWQHILAIAMKNRTDGIVTGDILNLSAAEIVFRGQRVAAVQRWHGRHCGSNDYKAGACNHAGTCLVKVGCRRGLRALFCPLLGASAHHHLGGLASGFHNVDGRRECHAVAAWTELAVAHHATRDVVDGNAGSVAESEVEGSLAAGYCSRQGAGLVDCGDEAHRHDLGVGRGVFYKVFFAIGTHVVGIAARGVERVKGHGIVAGIRPAHCLTLLSPRRLILIS